MVGASAASGGAPPFLVALLPGASVTHVQGGSQSFWKEAACLAHLALGQRGPRVPWDAPPLPWSPSPPRWLRETLGRRQPRPLPASPSALGSGLAVVQGALCAREPLASPCSAHASPWPGRWAASLREAAPLGMCYEAESFCPSGTLPRPFSQGSVLILGGNTGSFQKNPVPRQLGRLFLGLECRKWSRVCGVQVRTPPPPRPHSPGTAAGGSVGAGLPGSTPALLLLLQAGALGSLKTLPLLAVSWDPRTVQLGKEGRYKGRGLAKVNPGALAWVFQGWLPQAPMWNSVPSWLLGTPRGRVPVCQGPSSALMMGCPPPVHPPAPRDFEKV